MPLTVTGVAINAGVDEQEASFGPYSVKVIVPVGLTPLLSVATSDTLAPTVTGPTGLLTADRAGCATVITSNAPMVTLPTSERRYVPPRISVNRPAALLPAPIKGLLIIGNADITVKPCTLKPPLLASVASNGLVPAARLAVTDPLIGVPENAVASRTRL